MSAAEKQAKVMAAKQRSTCRASGQQGHWERDLVCPKRIHQRRQERRQRIRIIGEEPSGLLVVALKGEHLDEEKQRQLDQEVRRLCRRW